MASMSKVAALVLGAAAIFNVHATPVVVNAQGQAIARPAARIPAPSPIPEPTHYKLMLLGLAIVLLFGRRSAGRHKPWRKN